MQLFIRPLKQIIWQDKLIKRHRIQKPERIECEKDLIFCASHEKSIWNIERKLIAFTLIAFWFFLHFFNILKTNFFFYYIIYIYIFYSYIFNDAKCDDLTFVFCFLFLLVTPNYWFSCSLASLNSEHFLKADDKGLSCLKVMILFVFHSLVQMHYGVLNVTSFPKIRQYRVMVHWWRKISALLQNFSTSSKHSLCIYSSRLSMHQLPKY